MPSPETGDGISGSLRLQNIRDLLWCQRNPIKRLIKRGCFISHINIRKGVRVQHCSQPEKLQLFIRRRTPQL